MSTIDPSQITAADLSNPALSAQDLADITAARPDLRPYVATHPSLYPALGQWLADQGVVPAQPPAAEEPAVSEFEAPAEEAGEQAEPFAGAHEDAQTVADAAPAEAPVEQPAVEEPHVEAPAEPEAPVAEASADNLEQAILEGAAQSEAPTGDEATPAPSTEEQVAQSPFGNLPQLDAQAQPQPRVGAQPQAQQAPFGQPQYGQQGAQFGQPQYGQQAQPGQPQYGQPQYGQPGQQAQPGQSAGQQLGVAAQQLGAAANSAFSQFQNAVVAQTGKVSGRSVRATYSLIGIAAASLFLLISMILPYVDGVWRTYSLLGLESWFPVTFLLLLLINVGLGVAYWLTNQKWAFISVGAGSVLLALMTLIETLYFVSKVGDFDYMLMGFYMFSFFGLCLGAAGVILLLELKQGNVAPLDTTPALLNQMGQQGQQGFQGQQAYPTQQGQFGAQPQQGYSAPQSFQGQQAYPTQQGQFGAQPQQGYPTQQAGQPQYGQQPFGQTAQSQQNQQGQTGEQPQNPYSPQV